jgi:chemotaxis family two-component system sensor kinase Cph1
VWADAVQLERVFRNLLGNAIKFRDSRRLEIQVGAEETGAEWHFWVADNGIGIDPRYADRIFELFERLHAREEYPGTGIGLPICRKIAERHGGRIWVESQPGRGTTFHFTISKSGSEAPC